MAKCKKDESDDNKLVASINNVETLVQQVKDVDKILQNFNLRWKQINVWGSGQDKIKLAESNVSSGKYEHESLVNSIEDN